MQSQPHLHYYVPGQDHNAWTGGRCELGLPDGSTCNRSEHEDKQTIYSARSYTSLFWVLDMNVPDEPKAENLIRLAQQGWIYLQVTDTLHTELQQLRDKPDPTHEDRANYVRLRELVRPFPIIMGPAVVGHSRWDYAVYASDEDGARLRKVYGLLWPNSQCELDGGDCASNRGRRRFRDAMHIATSIRSCFGAFVTNDGPLRARRNALLADAHASRSTASKRRRRSRSTR